MATALRARFTGDLSQPVPIPEDAISRAVELMRSGRLHRYDEVRTGGSEVAALEAEFAAYLGRSYCIGLNSGGCGLFLAMKAAGVQPGDVVLTNAFTLAPVPGSIAHLGAQARLVGTTSDLTIDIPHLTHQLDQGNVRCLLLSHMRGHLADLDAIAGLCAERDVLLIEDCAHTLGASWRGRPTGTFGAAGVFSTQSFKHLNAGEGGLIITDDPVLAAKAVLLSGSYMFYGAHGAAPPSEYFAQLRYEMPNCSMRMSELVGALIRPQLAEVAGWREAWNARHDRIADFLRGVPHLHVPLRPPEEVYVGSSLQFLVEDLRADEIGRFVAEAAAHGVHIKWFGNDEPKGFTSRYHDWRYLADQSAMASSDAILARVCDLRIPVGLPLQDCVLIATVIEEAMRAILVPETSR